MFTLIILDSNIVGFQFGISSISLNNLSNSAFAGKSNLACVI